MNIDNPEKTQNTDGASETQEQQRADLVGQAGQASTNLGHSGNGRRWPTTAITETLC